MAGELPPELEKWLAPNEEDIIWQFFDATNLSKRRREILLPHLKAALLSTRNRTIEECAKVADGYTVVKTTGQRNVVADWIAEDIRSLISGSKS